MRITWRAVNKRFELENCSYAERSYPEAAQWKWDGHVWWTMLPATVLLLRGQKPPSGLTIAKEAFELLKLHLDKPKKQRKPRKEPAPRGNKMQRTFPESFQKRPLQRYVAPEYNGPRCVNCGGSVYFYELQNPPTCLWCELNGGNNVREHAT